MANITIYEWAGENLDGQGELRWPADTTTTVADSASHTLQASTRMIVLSCSANCRVAFGSSDPGDSGVPILAAVPNFFKINAGRGFNGTLNFIAG